MSRKQFITAYRPREFSEVIGQEEAVGTVQALMRNNTILSRALLFYGPHGIGKTSLARILARHLNCEQYNLNTFTTCGTCDFCVAAKVGDPAVEEMDFGTTRGIDTIRSLVDSLEFISTYKARVIILDEVHHITPAGATALLKALEEPPDNVLFVLVTTDPSKLLPSLRSRCVKVAFHRVDDSAMLSFLKQVTAKEEVSVPDYAFTYIIRGTQGILRDALGYLETVVSTLKMNPKADIGNHHVLEDALDNPKSIAEFLIGGVYTGSYIRAVACINSTMQSRSFDAKVFINNIYEYHRQTFNMLLDFDNAYKMLSSHYDDWYATIRDRIPKKAFLLNVDSAEMIFDVLIDLSEKASAFADMDKHLMHGVLRMVRAVKQHAALSYTSKSPIHKKYAPEVMREHP